MQSHQVFVDNVWRLLREREMSVYRLAKLLGTNQATVSQIIGGVNERAPIEKLRCPTLHTIDRFAVALGVTAEELLHPELVAA